MADPVESGKLALNFGKFFDSESLADVRLTVTAPRNFSRAYHAHRVVLGAASTYFAAQFSEAWSGSCAPSAGGDALFEVRVAVDEEPAHAHALLEFLYGREVELSLASAHPLGSALAPRRWPSLLRIRLRSSLSAQNYRAA